MENNKNKTDAELIVELFSQNFSVYRNEPLVIYGIGMMTKLVLDKFPDFNIVGLMDETRAGESIYGKPILSYDNVIDLNVKRIVIIATANNTNVIFNRIARFCKQNNIDVYSIGGRLLSAGSSIEMNLDKYKDVSAEVLKEKINSAEVISFDVFDTLIMRQCLYPRDIFHVIANRNELPSFYTARIKAETEMHAGENIYKIYDGVQTLLGLSDFERDSLLETEINTEKEFIVIRESVVAVLQYALSLGKQVYLVSDMYLPAELMSEVLKEKDIDIPKENILVSCDFGTWKGDKLFDILREKVGKRKILHLGDNKTVDIDSAIKHGIDSTFLLCSACEMLQDSLMCELLTYTERLSDRLTIGRFIAAQLNDPFLFNRTKGKLEVNDNYKLGQSFFAPIIFNYLVWLTQQVNKEHFDYVFCSARDGWLIKKIIEKNQDLYVKFPKLVYYYTSRKTAMRAMINAECDILEILKIMHAGTPKDILKRNFCLDDDEILERGGESEEEYILRHKSVIFSKAKETKDKTLRYIASLKIPKGAKIGYIDFTSSGTTQLGLTALTDFNVKGLYFLRLSGREFIDKKNVLNIDSLFDKQSFYCFSNTLLNYYTELENILTSYDPTVDEFDRNGNPIFAEEKRTQDFFSTLKVIHESITGYCNFFEISLFSDCSSAVSELMFSYLHENFSIQSASYFENNFVYDDVPNRIWKIFGNSNESSTEVINSIIFYGAGDMASHYNKILRQRGIYPVCYADYDSKKHGKIFLGKEILSLHDAVNKYPDSKIFITTAPEKWDSIVESLVDTGLVVRENVLNFTISKKYTSCSYIENSLTIKENGLLFCCVPGRNPPSLPINVHKPDANCLESFLHFREQTIDKLNQGATDICTNCQHLCNTYHIEQGKGKLTEMHFINEGLCQFNCIYCNRKCKNGQITPNEIPDYVGIISKFEQAKLIDRDNFMIDVSCDEITVLPNGKEIINGISNYPLTVFTNAGVFSQELAKALKQNPDSKIVTSVDAGTRETFARIKQRDCYGEVCNNLKRYAEYGNVCLKYILLPDINDNNDDITGFVDLCLSIKPLQVYVSRDTYSYLRKEKLSDRTFRFARLLIQKLQLNGFNVGFFGDFTVEDLKMLEV